MIFLHKHGHHAVPNDAVRSYPNGQAMPLWAACGFGPGEYYPADPPLGPFRYLFRDAPEAPHGPDTTAALDRLADTMVEAPAPANHPSSIAPVMTYLGQFIDHDVTANTDREVGLSRIDVDDVEPAARALVESGLGNIREGALNLDSVYGGAVLQGEFARKLSDAMRFPFDRSKLWAGTVVDTGNGSIPIPTDPARDLLRLDRLLKGNGSPISEDDIRDLPESLREMFVNADGSLRVQRAIIGDPRNDENLVVAQLHLAFIRMHNSIVDTAHLHGGPAGGDADALFDWARRELTSIYQWLVVHAYLPAVCDPGVVDAVIAQQAPLYRRLFADPDPALTAGRLPLPLEFSVAAFRFGHSMVRASYDWSRLFGRGIQGSTPLLDRAPFELLFAFTGGAATPMPLADGSGSAPRLPAHWPVEWERLVGPADPAALDRSARPIDTLLAPPLADLANEDDGDVTVGVMRHLARRNLRRGHRLNLPSAQACLAGIEARTGDVLPRLTVEQLKSGAGAQALEDGGFVTDTPLWFYVLKEAEVLGVGGRLGPLGSRLIAETLVGLLVHDPDSVWHRPGSGTDGRWHPRDGARPRGQIVDSLPAFFRGAGLM